VKCGPFSATKRLPHTTRILVGSDARIGRGVVIAVVDPSGCPALFPGKLVAVRSREVAVISRSHAGILIVDSRLIGVCPCGTTRGDLAVSDALVNTRLLIRRPLVDPVALVVSRLLRQQA
jgi:hypothetical protein